MKIFLRTFNNKINSKTGSPLPEGQYRGTPEWIQFQELLINCLNELGHITIVQPENPNVPDSIQLDEDWTYKTSIYVHQTKREKCEGTLFWMQMHMRELFTIDTNGWGADHSENNFKIGEVDKEEAKKFCEERSISLCNSGISKCEQPKESSNTPEVFILVPVQTPRDATILRHSPITVKYFLDSLMAWAEETQTHICIKMHPFNRVDTDLQMAVYDGESRSNYVHKVEGNIHELIKRSSGLFVINSGTGFEAIIHGKPVATFGDCDYSRATFNADIRRLAEARDFLFSYKEEERRIGYSLVFWYWMKHAYDVNREDTKERLTNYLRSHL